MVLYHELPEESGSVKLRNQKPDDHGKQHEREARKRVQPFPETGRSHPEQGDAGGCERKQNADQPFCETACGHAGVEAEPADPAATRQHAALEAKQ